MFFKKPVSPLSATRKSRPKGVIFYFETFQNEVLNNAEKLKIKREQSELDFWVMPPLQGSPQVIPLSPLTQSYKIQEKLENPTVSGFFLFLQKRNFWKKSPKKAGFRAGLWFF